MYLHVYILERLVQAYLILLCFALLHFIDTFFLFCFGLFFLHIEGLWLPCEEQCIVPTAFHDFVANCITFW